MIRLAVVCDRGGHLHNALMLIEQLPFAPELVVVTAGPEVESLRRRFESVEVIPYIFSWFGKRRFLNPVKAAVHSLRALALVLRYRPKVVISLGATDTVAFSVFAKLFGAQLIHVECMNQVVHPSITGRVLYPFCDRLAVQWPELLPAFGPKAVCDGWVLPASSAAAPPPVGSVRPRVFVAVSTGHFEALIHACAELTDRYEFFAQIGSGRYEPPFRFERTLSPEDLQRHMREADMVVTHAGTGMLSMVYREGKRGVVIPKQLRYGEANDGQVELAEKWGALGLGVYISDVEKLGEALELCRTQEPASVEFPRLGHTVVRWMEGEGSRVSAS